MILALKLITVKAEETSNLVNHFKDVEAMKSLKGFVRREINVDKQEDKSNVCILTYWETAEDLDAWIRSPAHKEGHKNKPDKENVISKSDYKFSVESV